MLCLIGMAGTSPAMTNCKVLRQNERLKFEAKLNFGLVTGEVREIGCAWAPDSTPRRLSTPSGDHPKPSVKARV
jgi:hypothetical protein